MSNRIKNLIWACGLFATFPIAYIFKGVFVRRTFSICPFYTITNIPCPLCGLTRSFSSAMHLDFIQASVYHPAWFLAAILILVYGTIFLLYSFKNSDNLLQLHKINSYLLYPFGGIVFLCGMFRYF